MTLYEDLKWRGLIKDISSPDLEKKLNEGGMTFYIGTDPTADSMHIGHYSSFLISKRLAKYGHHPLLLIGGATGRIGDPKPTAEREMKTIDEIKHNTLGLTKQAKELFGFEVVNNWDWSKDLNFVDFLRDYGKFFNINYMLDKDIIRRRLDTGITYTEFSYMIMQAMDFYWLFANKNCTMQVAGSDQWGNITAGIDLIRKKLGKEAYGFTMPLVTTKDGTKFGKSEGNALWLDKNKTSPYTMYQYLLNAEDEKVIDYLKVFTFLSKEEIDRLELEVKNNPHLREAQKTLAKEVVIFLHGEEEYNKAVKLTESLFNNKFDDLELSDIEDIFKNEKIREVETNKNIVDLLIDMGISSSKREAREFINGNAISINGNKINDLDLIIDDQYFLHNTYIIVKRGKKNYYIGKRK